MPHGISDRKALALPPICKYQQRVAALNVAENPNLVDDMAWWGLTRSDVTVVVALIPSVETI
jgi:hypothetical protein